MTNSDVADRRSRQITKFPCRMCLTNERMCLNADQKPAVSQMPISDMHVNKVRNNTGRFGRPRFPFGLQSLATHSVPKCVTVWTVAYSALECVTGSSVAHSLLGDPRKSLQIFPA